MKTVKILLFTFVGLIVVGLTVIIIVASRVPRLVKTGDRANDVALSLEDKELIEKRSSDVVGNMEAIECALDITAEKLHFSRRNNIEAGEANCVGYAKYYSTVCNYIFELKGLENTAEPVVGYIDVNGSNICDVLKSVVPDDYKNFVKDHDFVQIYIGADRAFIDPCIYDLIGNDLFDFESPFPVQ